jgi:hypothetical protein
MDFSVVGGLGEYGSKMGQSGLHGAHPLPSKPRLSPLHI